MGLILSAMLPFTGLMMTNIAEPKIIKTRKLFLFMHNMYY